MPLYEYKCINCNRHIEKIQKFSDPELTTCPHCGGQLERVLSAPAVSFKGGGWYADLYSSSKPKASTESSSTSGSDSSSAKTSNGSSAPAPAAASTAATSSDKK